MKGRELREERGQKCLSAVMNSRDNSNKFDELTNILLPRSLSPSPPLPSLLPAPYLLVPPLPPHSQRFYLGSNSELSKNRTLDRRDDRRARDNMKNSFINDACFADNA